MEGSKQSEVQSQTPIEGEVVRDDDKKKLSSEMKKVMTMMQSYEGPLPPASEFEKYEKVQKGSAKRIIGMAETALNAEIKDRWWHNITIFWSMISSRLILYVLIGVSVFLLMNGKEVPALLTGILPIVQGFFNIDFKKNNQNRSNEKSKNTKMKRPTKKNKTVEKIKQ